MFILYTEQIANLSRNGFSEKMYFLNIGVFRRVDAKAKKQLG